MKTAFSLIAMISIVTVCRGQSIYRYEVENVAPDIYVLKPRINDYRWVTSNIIVVINAEDVLVVDSGLLPDAAKAAITEIKKLTTKPVRFLVNTHWHGDHWQGNETFAASYPGLEIISAEEGYKGMSRNGMMWVNKFYLRYFQQMADGYEKSLKDGKSDDGKPLTETQRSQMTEGLTQLRQDISSIRNLKPKLPTLTFSEKMTLRKGGREFQFHYLGIGNTIGDAVIYLPQEKILIPGDLVVSPSPYESGSFSKEWVITSKKLRDFPFQTLIPGHGEVQHDGGYLDFLNAFYTEIFKQMNAAYLSGKVSMDEAKATVTHQSVINELAKNPVYPEFIKKLESDFVPAAVQSAWQRVKEGKGL